MKSVLRKCDIPEADFEQIARQGFVEVNMCYGSGEFRSSLWASSQRPSCS